MDPTEKRSGIWTPIWPGRRAALLRLALLTVIVFIVSWTINSLLIGSWNLLEGRSEESIRHFLEWLVAWIGSVAVLFLASLLPQVRRLLPRWRASSVCFVLVIAATLVALLYAEENWRGARAWDQARREIERRGGQLDLTSFIPKPVPDEQNFAATPFVKSWFEGENHGQVHKLWNDDFSRAHSLVGSSTSNRQEREFTDLVAWAAAFASVRMEPTNRTGGQLSETNAAGEFSSGRLDPAARRQAAPTVLEGLRTSAAFLAELRAASQRPYSRYPIDYDLENPWGILLHHLSVLKSTCDRLKLRASAELAMGQSDLALQDVELICKLGDSLKSEPFVVSFLLRGACIELALQPVWEGLAEHAWSDAQLQKLETLLQDYRFLAEMKMPLDCERAAGVLTADLVRIRGLGLLVELIGPGQPTSMDIKWANWWSGFIPNGWYHLEQVNYCRLFQTQIEGVVSPERQRLSPSRNSANTLLLEREIASGILGKSVGGFLHHRILAALLLPALHRVPVKAATAQTVTGLAAVGCALERFHLANGRYPETIEELVPKFISQLPIDVFTGQQHKYRRTGDGRFILYSIGWNETDDGGTPGKNLFDEKAGDWLWSYPAKQE